MKVEKSAWARKEIFDFFSTISNPFYMVTFTVDVTPLYDHVKKQKLSFYYALIYLCTKAINNIDAFRYTIQDGELQLLEERIPSFTDLKSGSELFYIVTIPCKGSLKEFCSAAAERSRAQNCFISSEDDTNDFIYFSCLPWVEMTALTNERDMNLDDAVPRIAWGKYTEHAGRKHLNLSIELNHKFVDGIHIGRFHEELSKLIADLE
ncbi:CatA-like O-acetyltransferase [Faecalispora anaeroviscerum]|uniref:CatA-like O-acetyltransferase n=1 Tax=Faecalispora anaeroviscerum TaxID=2991836 RepID=UPI0024BAB933|nr:CatA-like O-acetyltransferase [Faecalispora anaeroviscerum]